MIRRILPLAMLVMLALLAVVFTTGKERQFVNAASRLPDKVLGKAQSLQSDVKGTVVILQDIVAEEIVDDDEAEDEPMVLGVEDPADADDGGTESDGKTESDSGTEGDGAGGTERTEAGDGAEGTESADTAAEPQARAGVDG
ncbi:MAG: hypothetical protein ACYTG2_14335 [Planctomycetota bacterium]|jgi:hypothetical protein